MGVLRLGTVPYLNALPLIEGLDGREGVSLETAPPAELAARFREGAFDAALLPTAILVEMPGLGIVPGIGVACRGEVGSVLLRHRAPIESLREIHVDRESRTSTALLRILLSGRYGIHSRLVVADVRTGPPDDSEGYLAIGDHALMHRPEGFESLDLGAAWREWTGLPFVFAAWIVRGEPSPDLCGFLAEARERGRQALPRIVEEGARRLGLPADEVRTYLAGRIIHDLGPEEEKGLAEFLARLRGDSVAEGGGPRRVPVDNPRGGGEE